MNRFLQMATGLVLFTAVAHQACAQGIPRYRPQTPTVSPYLNLLRNDNGGVPNYYSFVRPQLNQQDFDQRMSDAARKQSMSILKLEEAALQTTTGPTGSGSVYGNRSHFYPNRRANLRNRQ